MPSLGSRSLTIKRSIQAQPWCCRSMQRRWARVHDVRFVATQGEYNPVIEKYRAKLDRKAKEEGHAGVKELREAYSEKIASLRHQSNTQHTPSRDPNHSSPSTLSSASSVPSPASQPPNSTQSPDVKTPRLPFSTSGPKPLSAYLDIPKVLDLPPREIEYVWRLRHASSSNSLCAVIPALTYQRIAETAKRHPQFILPLPREGQAAEIHFLQWTFPTPTTSTVLFTHLAEYKLRGEYSQPHTTVTHHLDLQQPKGLVLLQGNVIQGRGVSVEDGKWLLMCLQKFYGVGAEDVVAPRKKLLEQFSHGAEDFRLEELLEEAEKIS